MAIFLSGGGTPQQEAQIWRAAFAGVGRVVYWPFALDPVTARGARLWFRTALQELGIEVEAATWRSLEGREAASLDDVELLFVGGGSVSRLAGEVHAHGFARPLVEYLARGGRYYGGSAGAMILGHDLSYTARIDDDPDVVGMTGVGVLDQVVLPHVDTFAAGHAPAIAADLGRDVLALPEDGGVRIDAGSMTAIGPGAVELVHPDGTVEPVR